MYPATSSIADHHVIASSRDVFYVFRRGAVRPQERIRRGSSADAQVDQPGVAVHAGVSLRRDDHCYRGSDGDVYGGSAAAAVIGGYRHGVGAGIGWADAGLLRAGPRAPKEGTAPVGGKQYVGARSTEEIVVVRTRSIADAYRGEWVALGDSAYAELVGDRDGRRWVLQVADLDDYGVYAGGTHQVWRTVGQHEGVLAVGDLPRQVVGPREEVAVRIRTRDADVLEKIRTVGGFVEERKGSAQDVAFTGGAQVGTVEGAGAEILVGDDLVLARDRDQTGLKPVFTGVGVEINRAAQGRGGGHVPADQRSRATTKPVGRG